MVDYGQYPGYLVIQDVREVEAITAYWQGQRVDFLWASPPCQEFTVRDLPWGRNKDLPPPDLSIVHACFALAELLKPGLFILENVRGAQPYSGRDPLHRGSRYLWGDVALVPYSDGMKVGCCDGRIAPAPGIYRKKEAYSGTQAMERARIPFALAYGLALAAKGGIRE